MTILRSDEFFAALLCLVLLVFFAALSFVEGVIVFGLLVVIFGGLAVLGRGEG